MKKPQPENTQPQLALKIGGCTLVLLALSVIASGLLLLLAAFTRLIILIMTGN